MLIGSNVIQLTIFAVKSFQTGLKPYVNRSTEKTDHSNFFFYISFHMCFSQVNELDPVCCNLNCILVVSYLNITLVSHIY